MTITLIKARDRVRLRLADTGSTASWDDADVDAGLRDALASYGHWFPDEKQEAIPVADGATSIDLPESASQVRRVVDPRGAVVPLRGMPVRDTAADEQGWELWGSRIEFSRPLVAGEYTIWFTATRAFPENDGEPLPVPDGDHVLVISGAVLWCLEQRSIADWKRGPLPARYETTLRRARAEYDAAWRARLRRVRTGRLQGTA